MRWSDGEELSPSPPLSKPRHQGSDQVVDTDMASRERPTAFGVMAGLRVPPVSKNAQAPRHVAFGQHVLEKRISPAVCAIARPYLVRSNQFRLAVQYGSGGALWKRRDDEPAATCDSGDGVVPERSFSQASVVARPAGFGSVGFGSADIASSRHRASARGANRRSAAHHLSPWTPRSCGRAAEACHSRQRHCRQRRCR